MVIGALYFLLPLAATVEFSLKMRRNEYSFDAYRVVLTDPHFQASFGYSIMMGVFAIVLGVLLVVPTAYWVQLRLPMGVRTASTMTALPMAALSRVSTHSRTCSCFLV